MKFSFFLKKTIFHTKRCRRMPKNQLYLRKKGDTRHFMCNMTDKILRKWLIQ